MNQLVHLSIHVSIHSSIFYQQTHQSRKISWALVAFFWRYIMSRGNSLMVTNIVFDARNIPKYISTYYILQPYWEFYYLWFLQRIMNRRISQSSVAFYCNKYKLATVSNQNFCENCTKIFKCACLVCHCYNFGKIVRGRHWRECRE